MNIIDISVVLIFLGSCLLGWLRGGAREIVGFGGWLRAIAVAFFGASLVAPLLANLLDNVILRWVSAFIFVFVIERLFTWGLGALLTEIIEAAHLEGLNKVIGLSLGLLRGGALILIAIMLCMATLIPNTELWKESKLAPMLEHTVKIVTPFFQKNMNTEIQKNVKNAEKNFNRLNQNINQNINNTINKAVNNNVIINDNDKDKDKNINNINNNP